MQRGEPPFKNDYVCGVSKIRRHENSLKHVQYTKSVVSPRLFSEIGFNEVNNLNKQAREGEIIMAELFSVVHLSDSKIAQKLTLRHAKCAGIVKNIMASSNFNELVEELKINNFSLVEDETTDKGCMKTWL